MIHSSDLRRTSLILCCCFLCRNPRNHFSPFPTAVKTYGTSEQAGKVPGGPAEDGQRLGQDRIEPGKAGANVILGLIYLLLQLQ